jgi:N-acylneuraminate cytidylyltransferase
MWRRNGAYLEPLLEVEGVAEPFNGPRQRLPEVWWQNGYVDIVRPHVVLERNSMSGDAILAFPIDEPIVELDYPESLAEAERTLMSPSLADSSRYPRYPS